MNDMFMDAMDPLMCKLTPFSDAQFFLVISHFYQHNGMLHFFRRMI